MGTDWTAVATAGAAVITAAGAGFFATRATRSSEQSLKDQLDAQAKSLKDELDAQATQNRKQQLASMTTTALGYLTGGSQNRSIGIAGLKMVQTSSLAWNEEAWSLYSEAIKSLLYVQLLYLYMHARNQWESHEAANMKLISEWLLSSAFEELPEYERNNLANAMEHYRESAARRKGNVPTVCELIECLPGWITTLRTIHQVS